MVLTVVSKSRHSDVTGKLDALSKSQAVIEFDLNGLVLDANTNFLAIFGYTLAELKGQHHRLLVGEAERKSADYAEFWHKLGRGEFIADEFMRIAKDGRPIWIQASYNPVFGHDGKLVKIVKYATDISAQKARAIDSDSQIAAIHKSQAIIEFSMDGTILNANENFLTTLGYTLEEIKGKHHSMFVLPEDQGRAYQDFWAALGRGEYQASEYRRIGKDGREVWIQASYNPILDFGGKPFKVVKFATDTTRQVALLGSVRKLIDENISEIERSISQAGRQCHSGSTASLETSGNVQAVASGAEQLSASVREIASSMAKSKAAVDNAYDQTLYADQSTIRLNSAASSMGGIVEMIQNIAGQINLLALNATIESARAGEAGKGFAVVASEVKNLSRQATEATEQISREIRAMQAVSTEVVGSLSVIKESMEAVREYVTGTAGAVEEQSAVAREMSSNMQSAAGAVDSITDAIGMISGAVNIADEAIRRTRDAASSLHK